MIYNLLTPIPAYTWTAAVMNKQNTTFQMNLHMCPFLSVN